MNVQRILLRLTAYSLVRRLLHDRAWTVEGGAGAGLKLKLPQNLDYLSGSSERPVQDAVVRHLRASGVFYDIGANMGFFSLIAARVSGPSGRVYSFEPVAENAAMVRANASLNAFANIQLFELAVGRNSRDDELLLTGWDGGSAVSTSVVKPDSPVTRRQVRVVALDDLIPAENLLAPTFVKIDVEGLELEVIQGMTKTIAVAKPVLLYEIDDGNREAFLRRWQEVDDHVAALGYEVTHLADSYANLKWNVGHSLAFPKPVRT
jgi:FkbM family methyltransferase